MAGTTHVPKAVLINKMDRYLNNFNSNINSLLRIAESMHPNNGTIALLRTRVATAIQIAPDAIITASHDLYTYRKQISERDDAFFLKNKNTVFNANNADEEEKQIVNNLLPLFSNDWGKLTKDEKTKIFDIVNSLLTSYLEYGNIYNIIYPQ